MKTRLALLITTAMLGIGLPIPAHAATPFLYAVGGGDATITGYNGTAPTDLVIPDEITDDNGTYPVTAVGEYAFESNGLTELTLPNALTTIGGGAFSDNQLTELDLPNTLTTIGDFAFTSNQLTDLDLPGTLTTIGTYAFGYNQLTDLTLAGTLTTIGEYAFSYNQLTELDLPDTLTTISNGTFHSNQLTELTLPVSLATIGHGAFRNNQLTELAVPASVTSIGYESFAANPELDDVRFTGTAPQLDDDSLGTSDPTVRFPWKFGDPRATDGYTTPAWNGYDTIAVADVTFVGGGDIPDQSVDVNGTAVATKPADPAKANHIFTGWFADNATTPFDFSTPIAADVSLTAGFELAPFAPSLTGPAQATAKLGAEVTWEPTTLTGNPTSTVTATGLPNGLEIDSETGVITGTVTDPALTGNHDVTVTATNGIHPTATFELTISIEYFEYFIADGKATITGYHGATPADLVIPDEITDDDGTYPVTTIGGMAFYDKQLTDLTLPDTLTTIGEAAFQQNQLTELSLPNALTTIGGGAFAFNELPELSIPATVTMVGSSAFYDNLLTDLTLPDTLTTISDHAFAFNQLTDLTLPDTLTGIGSLSFYSNQLTALAVPANVTSIGQEAFASNPELDEVRFVGAAPGLGHDPLGTSDPTVRFPWKLGDPRVTDGYTTPTWNGYDTIAVADVSFVGGGDIEPQSVDVDGTSTAVKPADPVKTGHTFTGWFADTATTPFDFTTPVIGDVVLTAGFELVAVAPADPAITGVDPAIAGNPREGKTLTAKPGKISPAGATVAYQWRADGQVIKGATKPTLKLGKTHAGKRITVTITATRATAPPVTKTSAKTKIVSSAKRRIVVSTRKVGKNQPVTVTATGFKARQKITIWLGGDKRYTGRADSRGIITKAVTFAKGAKAGTHRVRITGHQAKGSRTRTVQTTVRYR